MTEELKTLVNDLKNIDPAVRGTFTAYLIIQIIRDLAYYAIAGIVTFTLGRRLIHAILTAYRESKRAASEWFLAIELLAIVILGIMGLISMLTAKQDMTDSLWVFCATFWREFLWPPTVMPIDAKGSGGGKRISRSGRSAPAEPSEDDEFYGRIPKGSGKSDLNILVQANAPSDAVLGRDGDGIKLQVTGEAGDSQSNKALIELVANAMGVKPYQVTLTKGHYQNRKAVQIQGISRDDLEIRLAGLADAE